MILHSAPEMAHGYYWHTMSITPGFRFTPIPNALIWYVLQGSNEYALIRSTVPVSVNATADNFVSLRGRRYSPSGTTTE